MIKQLLLNDSVLLPPERLREPDAWAGHIPFGLWIVEQTAPRVLVELGTHTGNSYFSFCQAVSVNRLVTRCYAVDTWQGDDQAGHYGEEVYQSVLRHNDQHYGGFSRLLRMTFDEAAAHFSEGSIDLLHIDGLHTYEAVRHDFETWRPKLSTRGVVLFHDTNVREGNFGVWRLWEELGAEYPHVHFIHSHGLGVLFVGKDQPEGVRGLLGEWSSPVGQVRVCRFFERLGHGVELELHNVGLRQTAADLTRSVGNLTLAVAERDAWLAGLNRIVAEREQHIAGLKKERAAIFASISWRITKPLRFCRRLASKGPRWLWQQMPLSFRSKQRIKRILLGSLPFLFRWSHSYRDWVNADASLRAQDEFFEDESFFETGSSMQADPYVSLLEAPPPEQVPVRLIALYLPQFHAIAENDLWWGEGFTEWTNVRPAQPQFQGHYQPHIPDELGYYNLLDPAVQRRQVELAKLYGVGGFCFYFYWFGGKRLLERPLENYLNNRELDLPFCLCWANENWSRRWDGLDCEILMAQQHSPEDDLAFIAHVAGYMRDARYIRINGRPLLVVYWPGLLPSAKATARRWRTWCRDNGLGEIYLAYTQSFETVHPDKYGFDAAIEFPPNNSSPPDITQSVTPLGKDFGGTVYDWRFFAGRSRNYKKPSYPLFRGVCPSWDNTARRKNRATVFLNTSPQVYQKWLSNAIRETCERIENVDERLIFVNAWNEWAEGAHLEPDQRFGYAWLDATRKALLGQSQVDADRRIIVVSHDAHPHGAQFLALGMVRSLTCDLGFAVEVVLLGQGRLKADFAALAPVHDLSGSGPEGSAAKKLAGALVLRGFRRALVNTTVSGWLVPVFREAGIESVCLVHELPGVIRDHGLSDNALHIASAARRVVFPAQMVADGFAQFATIDPDRQVIRPQGLYRRNGWRYDRQKAKDELRHKLSLAPEVKVVLAVGYADQRKGVDLFVESALAILAKRSDVEFVWVGHWEQGMQAQIERRLFDNPYRNRLRFVGYDPDTALYHAASDVYALTSREDPFPNVVLESFDVAVPVVAFAGTGGAAELVERVGGLVVPAHDTARFAEAVCRLLDDADLAGDRGARAQDHVDRHFSFRPYLFDLLGMLGLNLPRISVIVPNYNYARYIEQRLESIRGQSVPFYELILLDDASTDDSVRKMEHWLTTNRIEARLIVNRSNSGNVFAQWQQGVSLATGEYLWIAEADDLSDLDFLATVLPPFFSEKTVLSYCESRQIDADGTVVAKNYHEYLAQVSLHRWRATYSACGSEEICSSLSVMNTIPNVSAVVFRREAIASVFSRHFKEISRFRKAGDWIVYLRTLADGDIAFSPHPANSHRRHGSSVIAGSSAQSMCREIAEVQQLVAQEYNLGDEAQRKAAQYLALLHKQFGLHDNRVTIAAMEKV